MLPLLKKGFESVCFVVDRLIVGSLTNDLTIYKQLCVNHYFTNFGQSSMLAHQCSSGLVFSYMTFGCWEKACQKNSFRCQLLRLSATNFNSHWFQQSSSWRFTLGFIFQLLVMRQCFWLSYPQVCIVNNKVSEQISQVIILYYVPYDTTVHLKKEKKRTTCVLYAIGI
jgi:hypothetical protein